MGVEIFDQGILFLQAAGLGAAAGVVYDVFRLLRRRLGWHWLGNSLDLLFWLGVTAALFGFSLACGDGRVRVFYIAAFCLGVGVYFPTLGRGVRLILGKIADAFAFFLRVLSAPFRRLGRLIKKLRKRQKNSFKIGGNGLQ